MSELGRGGGRRGRRKIELKEERRVAERKRRGLSELGRGEVEGEGGGK